MNKVKVLFLAANPVGTAQLQLDQEIRGITAKVRAAAYRDALELISCWAVRPDDLLQAFLQHQPHIVHFSGHGTRTDQILLQDQNGQPRPVGPAALTQLFRTLKDNVRVVLLNACWTRPQAEALARTIDCTIGMNRAISDEAAVVFAASFYRAIGFGRTVQEAFDLAKVALLLEGIPEDQTPEMCVRTGVEATTIVLIPPPSPAGADVRPPQEAPGDGPAKTFRAMDRLTFVQTLGALAPSTFDLFVASIAHAASHISRRSTVAEQAAELVRWAESPTGPGLVALQEALAHFC
jgi:hypothetical protein